MILGLLGKMGLGLFAIITFLVEWFYPVFFELFRQGQTPGKKMMGIYVAQENATPISPASSLIRNLLRFVDMLPVMYGFGLAAMLLNRRFQRLGDIAASTVVLYQAEDTTLNDKIDIDPQQPPVSFTLKEQQALISFTHRHNRLTKDRAEELALLTESVVENQPDPANYLFGIGSWLLGKR
jgi:hypothetical protein